MSLILETTSGWLAFRKVLRPFWAKTQVILANSRTRWVSSFCLLLTLIYLFFSFPCFPSVWYMKVWPWGLAWRHWRAPHSVSIWSSFCGAFRIGIQAQGFLMRSYSERFIQSLIECSILRDKNCSFKMFCLLASCNIVLPCFYRTKLHLTRSFSMQTSILLSSGTEWSWRPTM